MADLRSRQLRELKPFSEAVRNIAVFYDGLVVPGALLLLASGTWIIVNFYGGWNFLRFLWLAGMVGLFAFEFIEGNTITRLYFMRLRRVTRSALNAGDVTPPAGSGRACANIHALPQSAAAISHRSAWGNTADDVTLVIPRLYPWGSQALPA